MPGAPERILTVFEQQARHRIGLEKQYADAEVMVARRGQIFAFVLSLVVVSIGGGLVASGHDGKGFALILLTLAGLAALMWATNRPPADDEKTDGDQLVGRQADEGD